MAFKNPLDGSWGEGWFGVWQLCGPAFIGVVGNGVIVLVKDFDGSRAG